MAAMILSSAAVAATALAVSAGLRLRSASTFLVAAYVLACTEVVALTEALSLLRSVDALGYEIGEAVLLAAAAAAWLRLGRPRPPLPRIDLAAARRHPALLLLAVLVGASLVFQAFLVVATPPNNPDALSYHLTRAVEWHQRHAVERFPIYDERQNALPQNAEIQILYTFSFLGRDTLAAAPQYLARLALLLGVYGLARAVGFGRPPAAFATFVASCLTLVVVQAVTAQNDLVVAAFVVAAACLGLEAVAGSARAAPAAGLAAGLAAGTKWTGVAAVPVLAVLLVAATRDRRRLAWIAVCAVIGFAAVGMYSYALNLDATGNPLGHASELGGLRHEAVSGGTASSVPRTLFRLVTDFADFSSYFRNANEDTSRFGTLGWMLILPLSAGFVLAWILRRTRAVRGALGLALPLFLILLAAGTPYNRFEGRLLIGPVMLCAALAACVYGRPLLTGGVAVLAAATLLLAILFNPAKPVGLDGTTPVWKLSRLAAELIKVPELEGVFSAFDALVPRNARVGAVLDGGVLTYPLYGPGLDRRLFYLRYNAPLEQADGLGLRWVVFSDPDLVDGSRAGWRVAPLGPGPWVLAERATTR